MSVYYTVYTYIYINSFYSSQSSHFFKILSFARIFSISRSNHVYSQTMVLHDWKLYHSIHMHTKCVCTDHRILIPLCDDGCDTSKVCEFDDFDILLSKSIHGVSLGSYGTCFHWDIYIS
jgi:hypothetical protein